MRSAARRVGWGTAVSVVTSTTTATPCASPSASCSCALRSTAQPVWTPQRCYVTLNRPLRQSWSRDRVRPWMCVKKECRSINKAVAPKCETCGTAKPVLQRWKCVDCGTVNFAGVKQCKECKAPTQKSAEYWMCADCEENNRVDALDDNGVCGFCGYDMAPRTVMEEKLLRQVEEAAAARQHEQERFDDVSLREADEQFGNPLEGKDQLDPSLRKSWSQPLAGSSRHLRLPTVAPFVPSTEPPKTRHSAVLRRNAQKMALVRDANAVPSGPPGFDWMCRDASCGHINPGDEEACMQCHAHIRPDNWECLMCGAENHLSRSRCFNCRTPIPVCWTCATCNTTTSIYDKACRSCGVVRPPTEPKRREDVIFDATSHNRTYTKQRDRSSGEWYCPSCNMLNFSRRTECFDCKTPRPAQSGGTGNADPFAASGWGADATSLGQASPTTAALQNNWICTQCQASNFRTRHDCWKCGRASEHQKAWSTDTTTTHIEREGFQTGAEDKSAEGKMNDAWKGDSDKWTCAKCYATNYRNRSDCFRCGSRKMAVAATRASKARRPVKL